MSVKNGKRLLTIGIVLAFAGTALAGCLGGDPGGDGEDLELTLGTLMPLTGALSNLGPSMQNGAKLAIEDVNAAGAGINITAFHEDDKTTDTSAITNTFNLLASRGVTAIAGPCCSGITASVLDLAVQNQIVVSSPSATSPTLTQRDNGVYFWRVAPTDEGQGVVLAELVASEDVKTVNIIFVNNDYGKGLADIFEESFTTSLSGAVTRKSGYEEGATEFSSQVTEACQGAGTAIDAIVLVAYTDDAAAILKGMQAQNCLDNVRLFASEGIYSPDAAVVTKAGKDAQGNFLAEGMMGTTPQAPGSRWSDHYRARYDSAPEQYSAESYDAVMYVALAALQAGSTEGRDIGENLLSIADGGEKCNTFAACAELIAAGTDIDYVGMAHDLEYTEKHEPRTGAYAHWQVTADGKMEITKENVVAGES